MQTTPSTFRTAQQLRDWLDDRDVDGFAADAIVRETAPARHASRVQAAREAAGEYLTRKWRLAALIEQADDAGWSRVGDYEFALVSFYRRDESASPVVVSLVDGLIWRRDAGRPSEEAVCARVAREEILAAAGAVANDDRYEVEAIAERHELLAWHYDPVSAVELRHPDTSEPATVAEPDPLEVLAILLADCYGIGGRDGVEGLATARHPAFGRLGSGRKQAGDGGAWTAAVREAAGEVVREMRPSGQFLDVVWAAGEPITDTAAAADGQPVPGRTVLSLATYAALEIEPEVLPVEWQYTIAREGLRRALGDRGWFDYPRLPGNFTIRFDGSAASWASLVNRLAPRPAGDPGTWTGRYGVAETWNGPATANLEQERATGAWITG